MALKESGEMYLESIYSLQKSIGNVRSIDLAEYMNYSKPSISRGVGILKNDGYINISNEGFITLTEKGLSLAKKVYERHTVITELLTRLGVNKEIAAKDACRIEHVISEESFNAIRKHTKL